MNKNQFLLQFTILFLGSIALGNETSNANLPKPGSFRVGAFSTFGMTSNSSMPMINGLQLVKTFDSIDSYIELAQAKYKEEPSFSNQTVSGEKVEQKSKIVATLGIKNLFANYFVWDLGVGINQFTYSNSGTDLTCCSNIQYTRKYDFSGLFVRPSFGVEISTNSWIFGFRLISWMQYFSKNVTNKVENKPDNTYITTALDSRDQDSIQSSHLLPPHMYVNFSF